MTQNTILVVDDDVALRDMVAFTLESEGYQVAEAGSRDEAIEQLQQQSYPIVLLDMGMPPEEHTPKEGIAVLDWLNLNQSETKVVVLTGQNAESTSYQALKHGAFDFLEKPVNKANIIASITRAKLFYSQEKKLKDDEGVQKVHVDAVLGEGVKSVRNQAEEKLVRQVLMDTGFNVHETARRLDLKRENVYYLIKKYGLQREKSE